MEGNHELEPTRIKSQSASTLNSQQSIRTNTTWRYDIFGPNRLGKGAMLFTGPDGIRDHRAKVDSEPYRYVGEGQTMSPEGTSEVAYLWRAPPSMAHPRPKSQCAGEIGWSVPNLLNENNYVQQRRAGAHIQLGEFRQALEDRHTHLFQNAWYPGPGEALMPNSDSSHVMNVYNYNPQHMNRPNTTAGSKPAPAGHRPASNASNNANNSNGNMNINNSNNYQSGLSTPLSSWSICSGQGARGIGNRRLSAGGSTASHNSVYSHSRHSYRR